MNNKMQNDRPLGIGGLRRRKGLCRFLASVAAAMFLFVSTAPALADTTSVLGGNAELTGRTRATLDSNGANAAVFSSSSASAVLDWAKFNVGAGQSMSFNGASTTFFNLVDGAAGKSQIDGMINGSGNVWVINPAGIAFGAGSSVNVGGLFAAAAGNLENAAALRDGTATMPSFSSFAGTVDVPGGTFTADRVALLGKTVKVDGAVMTDVGQLAIGAGDGMTVVDNVGEGKVTINVTDFADDPTETSVNLGDLDLGGSEDIGYGFPTASRGLYVRAGNGIKVSGEVNTDGNAMFYTKNGDISVTADGKVNANGILGEVDMIAGMDANGKGDVIVDGNVSADVDYGYGSIYAYAGYGIGGAGSEGDVNVGGSLVAGDRVDVSAFAGNVNLLQGSNLRSYDGSVLLNARNDVVVNGLVENVSNYQGTHIQMTTDEGDVIIRGGQNAGVNSYGRYGRIDIAAGMNDATGAHPVEGNVDIGGDLYATYAIDIESGSGKGATGSVKVEGTVEAGTAVEVTGESGIDVSGTVTSGTQTWLETAHGNLTVTQTGKVKTTGDGGKTVLASGIVEGGTGDIIVSGEVSAEGTMGLSPSFDILNPGVHFRGANGKGAIGRIEITETGKVHADRELGAVEIANASGEGARGDVVINGVVSSARRTYVTSAYGKNAQGNVIVNHEITVSGNNGIVGEDGTLIVTTGYGEGASGNVTINAKLTASHENSLVAVQAAGGIGASGNVEINDRVSAGEDVNVVAFNGRVAINDTVEARSETGTAKIWAINGSDGDAAGDVAFDAKGTVSAAAEVDVVADGDITQQGSSVSVHRGVAESKMFHSAVSSSAVNIRAKGSVGSDTDYVAVKGAVKAIACGNVYVAAAEGADFHGDENNSAITPGKIQTVSFGMENLKIDDVAERKTVDVATLTDEFNQLGDGALVADGNVGIYTAGRLEPSGLFSAGGDLTLSAATFGNIGNMSSYFQAGGTLTINNVGHPAHPQIAYFESVDGKEPKINNQPNDTVIFVDGRLAGGNLNIINKFGATEAFPVSTPELKSEQGIFGNPVFMHGDLDVANPMAVGNVDYMLQEIPRLTLASDFPLEVDKSVNTAGLNPKDVYRFGQHPQVAEEKPQMEQKEKKDDKAAAEQPAEPKVAMR